MSGEEEPTFEELKEAFDNAIQCEGIAGAQAQSRLELQTLRNKKFMWYAKKENELRVAIDRLLRNAP